METNNTIKVNDARHHFDFLKTLFGKKVAFCGSYAWSLIGLLTRNCEDIDVMVGYENDEDYKRVNYILLCLSKMYPTKHIPEEEVKGDHRAFEIDGIVYDVYLKRDYIAVFDDINIVHPACMFRNKLECNRDKDFYDFIEMDKLVKEEFGTFSELFNSYDMC